MPVVGADDMGTLNSDAPGGSGCPPLAAGTALLLGGWAGCCGGGGCWSRCCCCWPGGVGAPGDTGGTPCSPAAAGIAACCCCCCAASCAGPSSRDTACSCAAAALAAAPAPLPLAGRLRREGSGELAVSATAAPPRALAALLVRDTRSADRRCGPACKRAGGAGGRQGAMAGAPEHRAGRVHMHQAIRQQRQQHGDSKSRVVAVLQAGWPQASGGRRRAPLKLAPRLPGRLCSSALSYRSTELLLGRLSRPTEARRPAMGAGGGQGHGCRCHAIGSAAGASGASGVPPTTCRRPLRRSVLRERAPLLLAMPDSLDKSPASDLRPTLAGACCAALLLTGWWARPAARSGPAIARGCGGRWRSPPSQPVLRASLLEPQAAVGAPSLSVLGCPITLGAISWAASAAESPDKPSTPQPPPPPPTRHRPAPRCRVEDPSPRTQWQP